MTKYWVWNMVSIQLIRALENLWVARQRNGKIVVEGEVIYLDCEV